MPFQKKAEIVLENQNDVPYGQYFYIDYELYSDSPPEPVAYFHAHWHRENPCRGRAPELQVNSPEVNLPHLNAEGNYVILETEGCGHYVGCNLSVAHFQNSWWGEGDDDRFAVGYDFGRDDGFYARLFGPHEKFYRAVQIAVGHGHGLASMGVGQFYQSFRFQKRVHEAERGFAIQGGPFKLYRLNPKLAHDRCSFSFLSIRLQKQVMPAHDGAIAIAGLNAVEYRREPSALCRIKARI
jgi:hypothetical protein